MVVRGRRRARRHFRYAGITFISFTAVDRASNIHLKALIVVIMAGVGRVTGTLAAGILLGIVEAARRLSHRSGADDRDQFRAVHAHPAGAADRVVHPCLRSIGSARWPLAVVALGAIVLALLPFFASGYIDLALPVCLRQCRARDRLGVLLRHDALYLARNRGVLRHRHLCARDLCMYYVPIALAIAAAAVVGFLVALVVGLSTLRLRGVYFVIFTFGLTELVHQVINWWEININKTVSRYIFTDVSNNSIYRTLLVVALITVVGSWYVSRSRLGFALRAIGEDETVARHTGIDTTRAKVLCFALSASAMALVGAVLALRYPYIDASIAFNNSWSFQVLIAALLGGPGRYLGTDGRRGAAGAPVRLSGRHFPASFQHCAWVSASSSSSISFQAGLRR